MNAHTPIVMSLLALLMSSHGIDGGVFYFQETMTEPSVYAQDVSKLKDADELKQACIGFKDTNRYTLALFSSHFYSCCYCGIDIQGPCGCEPYPVQIRAVHA